MMLVGSLVVSAVFLAIVNLIALRDTRAGLAVVLLICGMAGLCGLLLAPTILLDAVFVFIAAANCLSHPRHPGRFLKSSLVATAATYALLSIYAYFDTRSWLQMRDKFPLASLEERLPHEKHSHAEAQKPGPSRERENHDDGIQVLEWKIEKAKRYFIGGRTKSLERLHASYVGIFVESPGFGASRMLGIPRIEELEVHDRGPIRQSRKTGENDDDPTPSREPFSPGVAAAMEIGGKEQAELLDAHTDAVADFVNPDGFGYFRDLRHVAGFDAHRFQKYPLQLEKLKMERLELVSILKHDPPAVYVSENLPRMDELGNAGTRPLDEFEKTALDALYAGQDIKFMQTVHQLRMLGSLRATRQCVKCHEVKRGELLGAFSYRFEW
jgi:hypothetical protein